MIQKTERAKLVLREANSFKKERVGVRFMCVLYVRVLYVTLGKKEDMGRYGKQKEFEKILHFSFLLPHTNRRIRFVVCRKGPPPKHLLQHP
jgi:hypothetical protein|tara:strand:+ start:9331 stop:9603 length:273 start_codon:yes stop_codon:yes gene_type:complete